MGFLDLIKMLKNAREETFANVYQAQRIEDQGYFAEKVFTKNSMNAVGKLQEKNLK